MTALRDAALAAEQDTARKARDQRAAERDNHLGPPNVLRIIRRNTKERD